ncbi:MAG TPA: hypothetical protein VLN44_04270, partial [Pyrinomonadaceae bacterium]|nr:hypothetical protein [Pyrinomonadaceae bacterium]
IFSLVDTVLLKPLPVKNPDELVTINGEQRDFSYLIFDQLRLRTGNISSRPFVVTDGATRMEMTNAKSRTQTQPVKVLLVSGQYFRVGKAKALTGRKRTLGDDQANGLEIARLSYECPFSRDKAVISKPVTLKQKLLVIVSLTPGELFGNAVERPDDVRKRFVRTADFHADGTPGSSALPHEDRSITRPAVRNQSCVSLIGRKVEAEDEDQGPDNGQPPPERAQERRR